MLKESDNPPISWPAKKSVTDFDGQWWVVHTKSRNEKALAHDLITKNVNYFLPMSWKVRHQRGRKIRSLLPLFGGYMFFCGEEKQRLEVLQTNRVANLIEVKDPERLVKELKQIEQTLAAGVPVVPHNYLKVGQRCRVTSGPLAHLEGIVVRTKDTARLVLQIDMLGQAASVEIDIDTIEKLEQ
ncbi:transcription termination/antitermination protein NusG [Planctomycetota bacterium]